MSQNAPIMSFTYLMLHTGQ